jgi:7-cyano-7-deazaguanine tRNA-ribosyltransferase
MIATAKSAISPGKPVHLFGAGHPLTIPLAIALGCDTFDSASYMLYAKEGRYMLPNGTARIDDLSYLPCPCSICTSHNLKELQSYPYDQRTIEIAKHNLYVLKAEVESVKQSIAEGRLWEYCMQKARAHPKLNEAMRLFSDFEFLGDGTPLFKDKALFLYDPIDQYRPEVRKFREAVRNASLPKSRKRLVLCPEGEIHPFYSTRIYARLRSMFPSDQICSYSPFLGVIPAEISDVFPASHNVASRSEFLASDFHTFVESLKQFIGSRGFEEVIVVHASDKDDKFVMDALRAAITGSHPKVSTLSIDKTAPG